MIAEKKKALVFCGNIACATLLGAMQGASSTLTAASSAARQTSRVALQNALKASEYKDLEVWAALIRFDVLQQAAAGGGPRDSAEGWHAIARLADSAVGNNRDAWKASPALYLSVTLDHTRALLRAGAVGDAKRTLGTLRSVPAAKHSWDFFKLLAIIECRQGAFVLLGTCPSVVGLAAPSSLFNSHDQAHTHNFLRR